MREQGKRLGIDFSKLIPSGQPKKSADNFGTGFTVPAGTTSIITTTTTNPIAKNN